MGQRCGVGLAFVASAMIAAAGCGGSSSSQGQGGEGQHCYPNATCNAGLVCLSNLCVMPPDGGAGGAGGGSGGRGGKGGATGSGGALGAAGTTGGSIAGTGGGSGGSIGGSGGAAAGVGGASAGTGGSAAGAGGSAGTGGATGGSGGGGAGGSAAGTGGTGGFVNTCGNGVKDLGEGCDDHNQTAGDGCGALCQIEAGWKCPTPGSPCVLDSLCGDGKVTVDEACDDANTAAGDGCAADCKSVDPGFECRVTGRLCVPLCGDAMRLGGEACDDGNTTDGDGCSSSCQIEPGASCTGSVGGKSTCKAAVCGNGMKEGNEGCDCGKDPANLPAGCNGPNGLFFGDASGCSTTCTREPPCRDTAGKNVACAVSCGNGAIETGEACDDGNNNPGDGCSATCTVEAGFMCSALMQDDAVDCTQAANTGKCLELPIVYRDFKNEGVSGGHPDFFYLGATLTSAVNETGVQGQGGTVNFNKRYCVPNAAGPAKKNDATNRCWDLPQANLGANGKPVFNAARTGGTDCDCQFIDWSNNNNGGHVPGYGNAGAAGKPLAGLVYTQGESSGGSPMYRGPAPIVTSAASFAQWWVDSAAFTGNTHTAGTLELASAGAGQYRYASQVYIVTGGFFPLDPPAHGFPLYGSAPAGPGAAPQTVGSEAMLCNIWPYWYSATSFGAGNGCRGDQYLYPPGLLPPDTLGGACPGGANCNGKWYTNQQGWYHDFWFTDEARMLFTYDGDFTLRFAAADDAFVFINGVLVADLGGIHQTIPAAVSVTGATGMATIIEGGSLDAAQTNVLACPSADPYTGLMMNNAANNDGQGHMNCTTATCDCRARTVNLGLQMGRSYELAIFHANRSPVESTYQLTLSGFEHGRSSCQPRCGDGIRSGNEQCDCGDSAAATPSDPSCGGRKNDDSYGGCTTQCRFGNYCGDAIPDGANEQCDLGAKNNTSAAYGTIGGCTPSCRWAHYCGDGILDAWAGETCDLGALNGPTSTCPASCRLLSP